MKRLAKNSLRVVLYPVLRYFGPRFNNIAARLDQIGTDVRSISPVSLPTRADFVQLERRLAHDLETTVEFAATLQRTAILIDQRTADLHRLISYELGKKQVELDPAVADHAAHLIVGTPVEKLGPGTAELLNWANAGDNRGFGAQAGVWFNPPVTTEHRAGEVVIRYVNERIVEIPFAMAVAGALPAGSRVLDVGATESTLALSLASLGLDVTAIDPRPYPLRHPHLNVVVAATEDWGGPDELFDAIFCISTIEHLGLSAYGQRSVDPNLDRTVMDRFHSWLAPSGELVLTTPYGQWSKDGFQRTYDSDHLEVLLKGWTILDRKVCRQTDDLVWATLTTAPSEEIWASGNRGVVLIRATPEK